MENSSISLSELSLKDLGAFRDQSSRECEEISMLIKQLSYLRQTFEEATECLSCLQKNKINNSGEKAMIPITSSMYVKGHVSNFDEVLVDIGTKYYVKKGIEDAKRYCRERVVLLEGKYEKVSNALNETQKGINIITDEINRRAAEPSC